MTNTINYTSLINLLRCPVVKWMLAQTVKCWTCNHEIDGVTPGWTLLHSYTLASNSHLHASVTQQYNLATAQQ